MKLHGQNARRTAGALAVGAAAAGLVLTGCGKTTPSASVGATSAAASTGASTASGGGSTATASAAATSSASQSSVTMSSGSLPFPTTVGDTWKYSNSNGSSSENKIASNTEVAGGQQVTMATAFSDNGTTTHTSYDYVVQPNGEISLPTSQFTSGMASSGVTIKVLSGGIYWPSAAQLSSGQPVHTTLTMQLTVEGKVQTITEHITSQGLGTQSVTVPAGTYSASVVNVQEVSAIDGYNTTIDDKTWLASGIGPVQTELLSVDGSKTDLTNKQELTSFTKG
jgi:hypothetical protein